MELQEKLHDEENIIAQRRAIINIEFDRIIKTEKVDHTLKKIISTLSIMFKGKTKYTEEYRSQWIEELMKKDKISIYYHTMRDSSINTLGTYQSALDKLLSNEFDSEKIESMIGLFNK